MGLGLLAVVLGRAVAVELVLPAVLVAVQRAVALAIGHATLTAAAGLFFGLGLDERRIDFKEILVAHFG